ncbi:MAG: hypothetical protein CR971_01325 [candidate division SR1 bacterium]|nr:MAG: hypothetical protein CR971_01325 [candidate division SR1 bacterium]
MKGKYSPKEGNEYLSFDDELRERIFNMPTIIHSIDKKDIRWIKGMIKIIQSSNKKYQRLSEKEKIDFLVSQTLDIRDHKEKYLASLKKHGVYDGFLKELIRQKIRELYGNKIFNNLGL